jgi:iduronate 2-sulfatase
MRPQLGAYGVPVVKSPNLDQLAATGLLFEYAYTQYAYCCPSRNSFLSGRRPERTRIMNFNTDFRRSVGANWTAMPQFFKDQAGYFTTSAGKIYHDGMDDALSWSYPSNQTHWIQCKQGDQILNESFGNYCGITNASKFPYTDEDMITHEGLLRLQMAAAQTKPWFVGTGLHRPHHSSRLPPGFYGPEVYPPTSGPGGSDPVKPPKHPLAPQGAPWMSGNWKEGDYRDPDHGCPDCAVPPVRSVEYRRWYYAGQCARQLDIRIYLLRMLPVLPDA